MAVMRLHRAGHPHIPHPGDRLTTTRTDRFAEKVAGAFGSMGMFYVLVAWQLGWMILATLGVPLLKSDPYPFVFCLFLSNLIQLWALPILGVATNRADEKRAAKADADHEALTFIATQQSQVAACTETLLARVLDLQQHLTVQDTVLAETADQRQATSGDATG